MKIFVGNCYVTVFSLILLPFYFPFTDLVHPTLYVTTVKKKNNNNKNI